MSKAFRNRIEDIKLELNKTEISFEEYEKAKEELDEETFNRLYTSKYNFIKFTDVYYRREPIDGVTDDEILMYLKLERFRIWRRAMIIFSITGVVLIPLGILLTIFMLTLM